MRKKLVSWDIDFFRFFMYDGNRRGGENMIIIPDSFKGSMSSTEVADIIAKEAKKCGYENCIKIPIADGGEGSVDCILASLGGHKEYVTVKSPENKDISAFYGIATDGTAIIEIAESSGITKQTSYQALEATTYGFGQLIRHALDKGCRKFLLCLGGSATTDCGCGMAAALGIGFFDGEEKTFIPVGGTLSQVTRIDLQGVDERIAESEFVVMCDVENPLYGEQGAAYIYAPQKGASQDEVLILDEGLKSICSVLKEYTGVDYSTLKGGGAAGGAGCGCAAFLGAKMKSGIEAMLEISKFDEKKEKCKLIVTGEGKLDQQSLMGKVLSGIKRHAGELPITVFCGICEIPEDELEIMGIHGIEIGRGIPVEESMRNGKKYLKEKAKDYFELSGGNTNE